MIGSSKTTWWIIAYGVVCGLLAAGIILLVSGQPRGKAIELRPAPSPQPIVVDVQGAVMNPGVFTLSRGSRVADAVEAAGGLTGDAETKTVNMAALLEDGQQVWVPQITPSPIPGEPLKSQADPVGTLININTASLSQLEELPQIGPKTAQKIIEYRETNGPFMDIEDIQNVDGIGPGIFEKIKDLITIY